MSLIRTLKTLEHVNNVVTYVVLGPRTQQPGSEIPQDGSFGVYAYLPSQYEYTELR